MLSTLTTIITQKKTVKNLYLKPINPYTKNTTFFSEAKQDFRHILIQETFFFARYVLKTTTMKERFFCKGYLLFFSDETFFLFLSKPRKNIIISYFRTLLLL